MSISTRRLLRSSGQEPGPELPASTKGIAIPEAIMRAQSNTQLDATLDDVAALGFGWIRFDIYWAAWETTQGTINYTQLDRIVNRCVARGIQIVGAINTTPTWARPGGHIDTYGPTTTTEQDNYASFAGRVAQHYQSVIQHYEIWNEPNLDQFWSPTPSASSYASLLQKAYTAIKAVDAGITVISGGTGGAGSAPDIPSDVFIAGIYSAGANQYCDVITTHPYPNRNGSGGVATGEMALSMSVRAYMDSHGDSTKPMWGTEMGIPTRESNGHQVSEAMQAQLATNAYAYWRAMHHAGPLFWYTYADSVSGNQWGVVRTDGSQKPSYAALQNVSST